MQFVHRLVVSSAAPGILEELRRLGLEPEVVEPIAAFEVTEDHPAWPTAEQWLATKFASDLVWTKFSDAELDAAAWLEVGTNFHQLYPQPEDTWMESTYENCCQRCCGGNRKQVAPFVVKKEPSWGRNSIFRLYWLGDEFFVKPELWRDVFAPLGVGKRDVVNRRGVVLSSVVQLDFEDGNTEKVHVICEGLVGEVCPACGVSKYSPIVRGRFPALQGLPRGQVARVQERFGFPRTGYADCPVLVSQQVRQELIERKIRGVTFTPVAGTGVPTP